MNHITVEALKARLDAGEALKIIDVREPNEIAEFNIGALPLPLSKITQMDVEPLEGMEAEELIIHCRSGVRSQQACQILETMGYTNTVNVTGGILAWIEKYQDAKIND